VRVHVAFTPDEAAEAPTGLVIDVIRATSTICQALASGYEHVYCAAEVEEARTLAAGIEDAVLGGERKAVRIPGFDLGNSPAEYVEPRARSVVMSTTNGTRAIVTAARRCERVLIASLLNLDAVVAAAAGHGEDVAVFCAGVQGAFTLDDAYVAGRIAELLDGASSDAAEAAIRLSRSFASAEQAFQLSHSGRNLHVAGLDADIVWCARESVLDVVPRFTGMFGAAAAISLPG